ncbi:class I SAM-dependent methyltransferase [Paenibacillus paeoniae]|uniref:class I SAM-dependent methyltransferase n=1 Tax=Paenibacillus paeoniae TaxID=2292705 RepID=UPI001F0B8035|nr:class I SAM-dependent methyltransferase [Paenibacillus paeoniae]
MQSDRIVRIRAEEKLYHYQCYEQHKLFESGSWLHKPVQTVMEVLPELIQSHSMRVLDLGSGVGRNTIPIAVYLKPFNGRVVAVDLLSSAIEGLIRYSREHQVDSYIEAVQTDIESYPIDAEGFDAIIAVSTLEHLSSEDELKRKLTEMAQGTKRGGINCIIIGLNIQETAIQTNESLDPMFEINMSTEAMNELLHHTYRGWETMKHLVKPLTFKIQRGNEPVRLTSDCITYVVRKPYL